ncbi:MAG: hypothetical protein ACFFCI_06925 [Promethearchaeota archaeon]
MTAKRIIRQEIQKYKKRVIAFNLIMIFIFLLVLALAVLYGKGISFIGLPLILNVYGILVLIVYYYNPDLFYGMWINQYRLIYRARKSWIVAVGFFLRLFIFIGGIYLAAFFIHLEFQ